MHQILLKDEIKPIIETQRRLNPTMKEVGRKEVLKWLDSGVIYPIFYSAWVGLVHVVLKEGGLTVIKNENSKLIPTRIVLGRRICIETIGS